MPKVRPCLMVGLIFTMLSTGTSILAFSPLMPITSYYNQTFLPSTDDLESFNLESNILSRILYFGDSNFLRHALYSIYGKKGKKTVSDIHLLIHDQGSTGVTQLLKSLSLVKSDLQVKFIDKAEFEYQSRPGSLSILTGSDEFLVVEDIGNFTAAGMESFYNWLVERENKGVTGRLILTGGAGLRQYFPEEFALNPIDHLDRVFDDAPEAIKYVVNHALSAHFFYGPRSKDDYNGVWNRMVESQNPGLSGNPRYKLIMNYCTDLVSRISKVKNRPLVREGYEMLVSLLQADVDAFKPKAQLNDAYRAFKRKHTEIMYSEVLTEDVLDRFHRKLVHEARFLELLKSMLP